MSPKGLSITTAVFLAFSSATASALDTTETFEKGLSDFELAIGFDGIGSREREYTINSEFKLGVGIIDNFSAHVGGVFSSNEYFGHPEGSVFAGIFGTPIDTAHFDLDIGLDLSFGTAGFQLTPFLEMNLDLKPNLGLWGIYIRIEEYLAGTNDALAGGTSHFRFTPVTNLAIGSYWTVVPDHQILLEYAAEIPNNPSAGENKFDAGGIALGYNVAVHEIVELLSQLAFTLPVGEIPFSAGLSIGIIVTMPGS